MLIFILAVGYKPLCIFISACHHFSRWAIRYNLCLQYVGIFFRENSLSSQSVDEKKDFRFYPAAQCHLIKQNIFNILTFSFLLLQKRNKKRAPKSKHPDFGFGSVMKLQRNCDFSLSNSTVV
jgi:hypothetical protein